MEWLALLLFLFLLFRFPGCMVPLLVVAGLVGWLAWHLLFAMPREREERERRIAQVRREKVRLVLTYDRSRCPEKGWPLHARIVNGADLTVERMHWKVDAFVPGHSTDLAGWSEPVVTDSILPPGAQQDLCIGLPPSLTGRRDLARLQYSASDVEVGFR